MPKLVRYASSLTCKPCKKVSARPFQVLCLSALLAAVQRSHHTNTRSTTKPRYWHAQPPPPLCCSSPLLLSAAPARRHYRRFLCRSYLPASSPLPHHATPRCRTHYHPFRGFSTTFNHSGLPFSIRSLSIGVSPSSNPSCETSLSQASAHSRRKKKTTRNRP